MISISTVKVGNGAVAARITNRILTGDEYKSLTKKELILILGIHEDEYEGYKTVFEDIYRPVKIAPNPAKKEQLKDIDKQIKQLQEAKKTLKGNT